MKSRKFAKQLKIQKIIDLSLVPYVTKVEELCEEELCKECAMRDSMCFPCRMIVMQESELLPGIVAFFAMQN